MRRFLVLLHHVTDHAQSLLVFGVGFLESFARFSERFIQGLVFGVQSVVVGCQAVQRVGGVGGFDVDEELGGGRRGRGTVEKFLFWGTLSATTGQRLEEERSGVFC